MNRAWIFPPRWPYSKRLKTVENSREKKGKNPYTIHAPFHAPGEKIHAPIHAPGEKIHALFMHLFTHLFIHLLTHLFNRKVVFLFIHRVCGACQIDPGCRPREGLRGGAEAEGSRGGEEGGGISSTP